VNQSESVKQIAKALSKAQSNFQAALKDSTNPFFKSKYADLESVIVSTKDELAKNGLAISQVVDFNLEGQEWLETKLLHESGEFIISKLLLGTYKGPQEKGSAITYFRRYSLQAILNSFASDDDAESISPRNNTQHKTPTTPAPKPALQPPAGIKQVTQTPVGGDYVWPWGQKKGKKLSEFSTNDIESAYAWVTSIDRPTQAHRVAIEALEKIIGNRAPVSTYEPEMPDYASETIPF
jgi:hypothetical protein